MQETWRMFVAIELPNDVLKAAGRVWRALAGKIPERAVKPVRPEGIHLTLKFLGDAPTSQIDAITAALVKAAEGHRPFELSVEGVGCFPDTSRPRVIWLGLTGETQALKHLQDAVESHIAPLGYPTEPRDFSPHLTLARIARNAHRNEIVTVGEVVSKSTVERLVSWRVARVSLMRSELHADGAIYTRVAEADLK
jgi:2'-5' RNA ligase